MPGYATTDALLQWRPRRALPLSLCGFNIFDCQYVTMAYCNATQWLRGTGRRFEYSVNYKF